MRNDLKIIDCDRHVMEPADIWDKYLEPAYRHHNVKMPGWYSFGTTIDSVASSRVGTAGIVPIDTAAATPHVGMDRYPMWRSKFKESIYRRFDNVAYVDDLDREDVDMAVLFTSIGLYATYRDDIDPGLAAAMSRAYNNWLHDYCSLDPARMKGVCLLPFHDVEMAQQELRRAATELGMVGIFWRPNPVMGRRVSDGAYDPLFATCEELGMPMCSHEGQQELLPYFARGRNNNQFTRHATCHPMEQMGSFLALASDGVFDRFPKFRVAFLESGSGWLPYWLERLDLMHDNPIFRDGYQGIEKPSEYFRMGRCYISCESREETIPMLSRLVGEDCLMWASDYPHPDDMEHFPNTVGGLFENQRISEEFRRKILWDNPMRFYQFEA